MINLFFSNKMDFLRNIVGRDKILATGYVESTSVDICALDTRFEHIFWQQW